MQLQRKQDNNNPQQSTSTEKLQKWERPVPVDWSVMEIDYDKEIPHGAHSGKTLQWVRENNDNYYQWIIRENIHVSWGLIRYKEQLKPKSLTSDTGDRWVMLIECPGTGRKSQWLEE